MEELSTIKPFCLGNIVHYNDAKGIGFISSDCAQTNIFFHVSNVVGTDGLPQTGKSVSFSLTKQKDGRFRANNVRILRSQPTMRAPNDSSILGSQTITREDFFCVRGTSVKGYQVSKHLGRIESRTVKIKQKGWIFNYEIEGYASSVSMSKDELIKSAKLLGANAILNFIYHSSYPPRESFPLPILESPNGGRLPKNAKYFWTEGEAVILLKE